MDNPVLPANIGLAIYRKQPVAEFLVKYIENDPCFDDDFKFWIARIALESRRLSILKILSAKMDMKPHMKRLFCRSVRTDRPDLMNFAIDVCCGDTECIKSLYNNKILYMPYITARCYRILNDNFTIEKEHLITSALKSVQKLRASLKVFNYGVCEYMLIYVDMPKCDKKITRYLNARNSIETLTVVTV